MINFNIGDLIYRPNTFFGIIIDIKDKISIKIIHFVPPLDPTQAWLYMYQIFPGVSKDNNNMIFKCYDVRLMNDIREKKIFIKKAF